MRGEICIWLSVLSGWLIAGNILLAEEPSTEGHQPDWSSWCTSYAEGVTLAEEQGKMMLIYFQEVKEDELRRRFESETVADPVVCSKLQNYVCVKLPVDAKITTEEDEQCSLLDHPALKEMLGRQGVAILDFAHKDAPYYGCVVSTFPLVQKHWYTPQHMEVILDLPPGTLTQRTLIYAVRTHPDKPASTQGQVDPYLLGEAESHSQYQARIRLQGHHAWESRFHRIVARLPMALTAKEVCAESWPGENLVEAAIECVRCWRLSPGHWGAVRALHPLYGYDMKRGSNGTWYATGIFAEGSVQPASYQTDAAAAEPSNQGPQHGAGGTR